MINELSLTNKIFQSNIQYYLLQGIFPSVSHLHQSPIIQFAFDDYNTIYPYVLLIMHARERGSISRSGTYISVFFANFNVTYFDINSIIQYDVLFEVFRTWVLREILCFLQYHDVLLSHLDSRIAMCTRKYYSKVLEDNFLTIL